MEDNDFWGLLRYLMLVAVIFFGALFLALLLSSSLQKVAERLPSIR